MKKFLEEYGYAIVGIVVVICLVAIVTPVGKNIKTQLTDMIGNFASKTSEKADSSLDAIDITSINADESGEALGTLTFSINTGAFLEMYNEIVFTSVTEGATWQNLIDAGTTLTLTNGDETVTIYFTSDNGVACVNAVETEIYGGESIQLVTYNDVSYDFVSATNEIEIGTSYNICPE